MADRLTEEREAEIREWVEGVWGLSRAGARDLLAELDATRDELRTARERIARQEASIGELRAEVAKVRAMLDDVTGRAYGDDAYIISLEKRIKVADAIVANNATTADLLARVRELEAQLAAPPTTYLPIDGPEEPVGQAIDRLTRERDVAVARAEAAEAQLAALREAAVDLLAVDDVASMTHHEECPSHDGDACGGHCGVAVVASLRRAADAAQPTAEAYKRRVQAEALRMASERFAYDHQDAPSAEVVMDWLRAEAERIEKGGDL